MGEGGRWRGHLACGRGIFWGDGGMGNDHEWARMGTNFHEFSRIFTTGEGRRMGNGGVMGVGCFSRNAAQWDSPGQRPGKGKVFLLSPEGAELRVLRPFRAWDIFYY